MGNYNAYLKKNTANFSIMTYPRKLSPHNKFPPSEKKQTLNIGIRSEWFKNINWLHPS